MSSETVKALKEWTICIIILIALMWGIFGCQAAREAKKDKAAFARVLGSTILRDTMYKALEPSHPCNPITTTIYKKGDSIPYPILVFDSNRVIKYLDSVAALRWKGTNLIDTSASPFIETTECNRLIAEAFNTAYKQAILECNQRKIPVRVDTVFNTEQDGRKIDELSKERDVLDGMYQQSEKQANLTSGMAKKRLWWIVALVALLCGSIFLNLRSSLRKIPTTSLSNIFSKKPS